MRRSSSPSDRAGSRLFAGVFSRGDVARAVSDDAWLQAMLDVEAALARALAKVGRASSEAARVVTAAARAEQFDAAAIGAGSIATGNPVVPMVDALSAVLPVEAAETVHAGATSQDVIDTAMMLLAQRAGRLVIADLAAAAEAAALLAELHRGTVMAGRTLLQQAPPVTFGLKAAGWLVGLDEARTRLAEVVQARLAVQFGGAAGTLASLGERGVDVAEWLAKELGLASPVLPWHSSRLRIVEVAGALAGASVVLGKIARDVTLLAQPELGEVQEAEGPDRGGSSTMPHKRNPVGAVAILGCTRRIPGLLATLTACGEHEHERAAGAWHAEWETFTDLIRLTGSAAAWARELLAGLRLDPARMRGNLDSARGVPLSEHLSTLLAPALGRRKALALVREASLRAQDSGRPLIDALFEDPATQAALAGAGIDRDRAREALDPERYLGSTQTWIDRALAAHRACIAREGSP